MKPILFFDTETTGLPDWNVPSDDECQPHIVELAALLVDPKSMNSLASLGVIVRPDGWVIPDETIEVHGISNEKAAEEGISEKDALEMFLALYSKSSIRVAHNTTFDNRIIRIALKRHLPDAVSDEQWKDKSSYHCTMIDHSKTHGGKWPKLQEAYKFHFGVDFEDAHRAMSDVKACMKVYFAARELAKNAA